VVEGVLEAFVFRHRSPVLVNFHNLVLFEHNKSVRSALYVRLNVDSKFRPLIRSRS
jgi:hypothetical protein